MALQVGEAWLRGSVAVGGSPVTWAQAPLMEGTLPPGQAGWKAQLGWAGWVGLLGPRVLCPLPLLCLQFEAFSAEGLAPGWSLLVQGHSDSPEDK